MFEEKTSMKQVYTAALGAFWGGLALAAFIWFLSFISNIENDISVEYLSEIPIEDLTDFSHQEAFSYLEGHTEIELESNNLPNYSDFNLNHTMFGTFGSNLALVYSLENHSNKHVRKVRIESAHSPLLIISDPRDGTTLISDLSEGAEVAVRPDSKIQVVVIADQRSRHFRFRTADNATLFWHQDELLEIYDFIYIRESLPAFSTLIKYPFLFLVLAAFGIIFSGISILIIFLNSSLSRRIRTAKSIGITDLAIYSLVIEQTKELDRNKYEKIVKKREEIESSLSR